MQEQNEINLRLAKNQTWLGKFPYVIFPSYKSKSGKSCRASVWEVFYNDGKGGTLREVDSDHWPYPLVMTSIAIEMAMEIVNCPLKMVIFHIVMLNYQRVSSGDHGGVMALTV